MRAKKSLGQHFLTAVSVTEAMCDAANVSAHDTVLEIGPGTGILTRTLLARGAKVVAIEKDARMIPLLQETFARERAQKQLHIIEGDALECEHMPELRGILSKKYKLVANIPYYITGALVRAFLSSRRQPASLTFLVQKEVAERIARDTKESILSLSVKVYGHPRYVQTVKAGSFSPAPNVDSAILHVADVSRIHFKKAGSEELFFAVVRSGFAQKRKTLFGNLAKVFGKDAVTRACAEAGIGEKVRAEDVSLDTWLMLARVLAKTKPN